MSFTTEGIVFRAAKTAQGRNIILIFTKEQGKISVGTNIDQSRKSKSSLAIRPFTYGNYQIYDGRSYYGLDGAETIKSYYSLGEDLDRYVAASYVLELTDKLLPDDLPQPEAFSLLVEFLKALEQREKKQDTLVLAYEIKLLDVLGVFPVMDRCVVCGAKEGLRFFSVGDGGMMCEKCGREKLDKGASDLLYSTSFDIVEVIRFFVNNPLGSFSKIALDQEVSKELRRILKEYMEYHFDIGELKSEGLFSAGNVSV